MAALRTHGPAVVVFALVAVAIAALAAAVTHKRYEAHTTIQIAPVSASDPTWFGVPALPHGDPRRAASAFATVVVSPEIGVIVRTQLGLSSEPSVEAHVRPSSAVVELRADAGNAEGAARIANAFVDNALARRTAAFQADLAAAVGRVRAELGTVQASAPEATQLRRRLATLRGLAGAPDPTAHVLTRAVPADSPVRPRWSASLPAALAAALLAGAGLAAALGGARRIRRVRDLDGLPVLAPHTIAETLAGLAPDRTPPRLVVFTSAGADDGRSEAAAFVARGLANPGRRVVLVGADAEGGLDRVLGVDGADGLARFLSGEATAEQALVPVMDAPGLELLPASPLRARLADLVPAERLERALDELRLRADLVLVDAPSPLDGGAGAALAAAADAVVVVVRLGHTDRAALAAVRGALRPGAPAGYLVAR